MRKLILPLILIGAALAQAPITNILPPTPAVGSVTLAMQANLASNSIPCNATASPAVQTACSVATVMTLLGAAPLSSPTFTGTPTSPSFTSSDTTGGAGALGYAMQISAVGNSSSLGGPVASTTYYFGGLSALTTSLWSTLFTTEGISRIYIPRAGTIRYANVSFFCGGTLASGQTSTVYIRLNNTTDTAISSSVVNTSANTAFSNAGLSIAVAQGDYIEFKWITPAWSPNSPTEVVVSGSVWIQ